MDFHDHEEGIDGVVLEYPLKDSQESDAPTFNMVDEDMVDNDQAIRNEELSLLEFIIGIDNT